MKTFTIPQRQARPPEHLSDEARKSLVSLLEFDAANLEYPEIDNAQAWRELISHAKQYFLELGVLYQQAEIPGITVETTELNGVTAHKALHDRMAERFKDKVYLHFHGGGLIFLEGEGCRREGLFMAKRTGLNTVSVDFRVPPDFPYPCGLDDAVAAYEAIVDAYGAENIIVGGMSGGGNLAPAMLLRARDQGLPIPAGLILFTPEVDLTESGDTFETLMGVDPVLTQKLAPQIALYANGQDLHHPYLSPLFGDFSAGWPPTLLQSGTRDLFLSNTVRMHRAIRSCGVRSELHVWEAMPHGGFGDCPEDEEIAQEVRSFINSIWGS